MKPVPFLLLVLLVFQAVPPAIADHDASTDPLPNLYVRKQWHKPDLWEWVDQANGRYNIIYRVKNKGESGAVASNTTINITIIPDNGSIPSFSSVVIDPVPELNVGEVYDGTVGPFTCLCNHTVVISICADGDDRIAESEESDNCKATTFDSPASACKPDLTIDRCAVRWVNRSERTFNVTYAVANIGNGDAGESTSRVNGIDDPVPALASGENHSSVVGPFLLSGYEVAIDICADHHDNVTESSETNNCYSDTIGLPDLQIYIVSKDWIDAQNRSYGITYTVCNYGGAESENATIRVYNDRDLVMVTEHPLVRAGECVEKMLSTFTMTGDNDTIRVCVESDGDTCCDESIFRYGGCLATDGSGKLFTCCDRVDRSCTFTGDIYCATRESGKDYPHGLFVGADDIVIDGCGYAIIGDRSACSMEYTDGYINWTGIRGEGYRNVTIRNLTVKNFCNGISIADSDDATIEDCEIRDNGATVQCNYGITVENSSRTTIDRCEVHNQLGILTDTNVCGGHGINFDCGSSYCNVTDSTISGNYLSGILAPPTCKYLRIANNTIADNGCCDRSGFCAGVNLHWRGGYGQVTNSTVLGNVIRNNTGSGVYVAQGATTIRDNIITGSRNGTDIPGTGIFIDDGERTFLYNNTCCGNEGTDIADRGFATFGDCNACDRTENYDDEGTIGCIFYCGGANGVCVGETHNFSCGMVITESCRFSGSMNCEGYGGYSGCEGADCEDKICGCGLIAGADDIVIDGCGYTIAGNLTGVGIFSNRTNVTIRNLQIRAFATGIVVEDAETNAIVDCTLRKNSLAGINFSADQGTLRGNRVYDNSGTGIMVAGNENILSNNIAARNRGDGLSFGSCAANNTLTANAIGDNTGVDIYGDGTDHQTNIGNDNICDFTQDYSDVGRTDGRDGCTYPWTPPDLVISRKEEYWVNATNKTTDRTYEIQYTIKNIGKPDSREAGPSTTYLYIDSDHVKGANDRVGSLSAGASSTATFDYIARASCDRDRIMVCADGSDAVTENNDFDRFLCNEIGCYTVEGIFCDKEANNCISNVFEVADDDDPIPDADAACVTAGGTAYRCGDTIEESCTFDGNIGCPAGHGLVIGKNDITIDGNGSALIGPKNASCAYISENDPGNGDCGIYNYGWDRVTIKDMTISGFCNGIGLHGTGTGQVKGNIIENCNIHDNGNPSEGNSHGIHLCYARDTTIRDNEIHHNRGTGTMCSGGGNGIFLYAGAIENANNRIAGNKLYDNDRSGFFTKQGMHGCTIEGNTVEHNSRNPGTGRMNGGIVLQCVGSNKNTIRDNTVQYDHGRCGIFIGGDYNTVSKNIVTDNEGDGIFMGRCDGGSTNNDLNDNEVCGSGGTDVKTCGEDYNNHGTDNCCDRTENYEDEGGDGDEGLGGCTNSCEARLKPDLTVTEKSEAWINPENPENRKYNVTCTVANIGSVDAPPCGIRISIDGDWQDHPVVQLNASDSRTHIFGAFTMSGTSDEIIVRVDPEGEIDEICEDNNQLTNIWYAMPDLTVTAFDVPGAGNLILNEESTANATIANIGTISTKGAFDVTLYVNDNEEGTFRVPELASGGSVTLPFTWFVGASNLLRVVADSGGEIAEWDEGNNDAIETRSLGSGEDPQDPSNTDPKPSIGGNLPEGPNTEIDLDEVTHGGNMDYDMDELGGNDSASGRVSKERVHAQLFRSTPFLSNVSDIVVSYNGLAVIGALSLLLLFYFGYRGEIRMHRRNNR